MSGASFFVGGHNNSSCSLSCFDLRKSSNGPFEIEENGLEMLNISNINLDYGDIEASPSKKVPFTPKFNQIPTKPKERHYLFRENE